MRLRAVKAELGGHSRHAAVVAGAVARRRMPVEAHINVVEEPITHHEGFGAAAFLGGTAIEANRSLDVALLHLFLNGDARRCRCHTEEMMSASVAIAITLDAL